MWYIILTTFIATFIIYRRLKSGRAKVAVVVLGDIGRSPRMQYHALSLVRNKYEVFFVGYAGSRPPEEITNKSTIHLSYMKEPPEIIQSLPRLVVYAVKTVWQSLVLLLTLLTRPKTSYILLQNPPCIPSLAVSWFVGLLQGTKLVVDWHNYGYTILSLALSARHPLVRFGKRYEHFFGRFADFNICVTEAMKQDLKNNWKISAITHHDRPPAKFKSTSVAKQHELFMKLKEQYDVFKPQSESEIDTEEETIFTRRTSSGQCVLPKDRPVLLVSSTSWTEDEDFSILLTALQDYEARKDDDKYLPSIICAITGKGPQKEFYQNKIAQLQLQHIQICTPWLEAEDYPILLGSADVGVCLHKSSSGLDLPMKVVDMFGCGLPVCAIHFQCIDELVKHDVNGRIFHTSKQLAKQLQDLLRDHPHESETLDFYRENLKSFQAVRWDHTWDDNVWPIFEI